jgi:hypothetical protein
VSLFNEVIGAVIFIAGVTGVVMQYTRLDTRRSMRVSQVISASRGIRVRIFLLVATGGVMYISIGTAAWPVAAGVWFGIVAWEASVQATAWIRRVGHRRASRAS